MMAAWYRSSLQGLGLTVFTTLTGCFVDQPSAADRVCQPGAAACQCMSGAVCSDNLACEDNICRSQRCADGLALCGCKDDGTCNTGLVCIEDSCLPPMQAPEPPGPTDPNPSGTSGMSGSEGEVESGVDPTDSDSDTDILLNCGCRWEQEAIFFTCGEGPLQAPDPAAFPRDCAPESLELLDAPGLVRACDTYVPAITFEGCCIGNAALFCGSGQVVVEDCGSAGLCGGGSPGSP